MYGASEHTWSVTSVACTSHDIVPCLTSTAWVSLIPMQAPLSFPSLAVCARGEPGNKATARYYIKSGHMAGATPTYAVIISQ